MISLTCSVDVKVGRFVGEVAHGFDSRAFDRDLGGVAERLVHIHLERTFGNWLTGKQHRHLGNKNNKYSETFKGKRSAYNMCMQKHLVILLIVV